MVRQALICAKDPSQANQLNYIESHITAMEAIYVYGMNRSMRGFGAIPPVPKHLSEQTIKTFGPIGVLMNSQTQRIGKNNNNGVT